MAQYLARSLLGLLVVIFVVSVITFVLMHEIPGGPFVREKKLPQSALDNLNAKYHLDDPLWKQYVDYMLDLTVPTVTTGEKKFSVIDDYLINIELPFGDHTTIRWMNFAPPIPSARGRLTASSVITSPTRCSSAWRRWLWPW